MSEVQREMTLDEWCSRLPESHLANRELKDLRQRLAQAEAERETAEAEAENADLKAECERLVKDQRYSIDQYNEARAALKEEKALFASYVEMHNAAKQDWWAEREKLGDTLVRHHDMNVKLRKALKNTALDRLYRTRGMYDAIEELLEEVEKNERLEAALKEFDALARRYHNGYDPQMREDLGMKKPESPLQALEEVLDEKHDIDTAGWEAALKRLREEVAAWKGEVERLRRERWSSSGQSNQILRHFADGERGEG